MESTFQTTLIEAENSPKTCVLSSIKVSMCIPRHIQASIPQNHNNLASYPVFNYPFITFVIKWGGF